MRALATLACLVWGSLAQAFDLPALYDVTGVASNDVLNVREAPNATTPIIGFLAPDATGVEVVRRSENGRWGMVNTNEQSGWASLRFLERQPFQSAVPERYRCFGTEPFWSLDVASGSVTWSAIGDPDIGMSKEFTEAGMRQDRFGLSAQAGSHQLSASIRREACNDGMSDRDYGFGIDLIYRLGSQGRMFSGCCTLAD